MGVELPEVGFGEFAERLRACCPEPLSNPQVEALHRHYSELRRWNRRVSLVGPTDVKVVVERHYGESLAALPCLPPGEGELVDVGTGAGFPGFVLAVARPRLRVTLVEAKGRKWSFLESVCRSASLSCNCLNARVGATPVEGLPEQVDWITSRAVRIEDLGLPVLIPKVAVGGSLLLWIGREDPALPEPWKVVREIRLAGSTDRRLLQAARGENPPEDR